jgi:hypothetical protein
MEETEILLDKITQMRLTVALAEVFPEIKEKLSISDDTISEITGIEPEKISGISSRRYIPSWQEYLTLVFLFISNEKSRSFVEEKGLFPKQLKEAMAVNRKEHR